MARESAMESTDDERPSTRASTVTRDSNPSEGKSTRTNRATPGSRESRGVMPKINRSTVRFSEVSSVRFTKQSRQFPNQRQSGGMNEAIALLQRPTQINNQEIFPNKRGIIKCQPWRIKTMNQVPLLPHNAVPYKKLKIQFPFIFEERSLAEIFCPRCDMFFNSLDEYHDHLIIRQFKEPYVKKLAEMKKAIELAKMNISESKYNEAQRYGQDLTHKRAIVEDLDFIDSRNGRKFHLNKNKRIYSQEKCLNEVRDFRDRCRVMRRKRTKATLGLGGKQAANLRKMVLERLKSNQSDHEKKLEDIQERVSMMLRKRMPTILNKTRFNIQGNNPLPVA